MAEEERREGRGRKAIFVISVNQRSKPVIFILTTYHIYAPKMLHINSVLVSSVLRITLVKQMFAELVF
jgi:hypothetical protein